MSSKPDEQDVPYTLEVLDGTEIAVCRWSGPIALEDRIACRQAMVEFCNSKNVDNLLIDGREQQSRTDIVDSYDFAKDVPEEMFGLNIAVVHRQEDESLRFIETVAFNRGAQTRAFTDYDSALRWLESL
jgi:hypothetical protein